ncbi:MAG: imidazole glycerol phosphate synthase subunit HisH [Nitrospinae bacterium]|nr:imidazole glycerol phosphate synthase subunit HisH [Nitrospinota bacterium]
MTAEFVVVDYGMGNVLSVRNALAKIGAEAVLSDDPRVLETATGVIMPGIGGFPECMRALEDAGLTGPLRRVIEQGVPYLGICLGLQILFEESEEFGSTPGLGILPGRVRRFPEGMTENGGALPLKVPHMGWNQPQFHNQSPILAGVPQGAHFYFVHSYYAEPSEAARPWIAATCDFGVPFIASVHRKNLFATQFHPEKSGTLGLGILRKFVDICRAQKTASA